MPVSPIPESEEIAKATYAKKRYRFIGSPKGVHSITHQGCTFTVPALAPYVAAGTGETWLTVQNSWLQHFHELFQNLYYNREFLSSQDQKIFALLASCCDLNSYRENNPISYRQTGKRLPCRNKNSVRIQWISGLCEAYPISLSPIELLEYPLNIWFEADVLRTYATGKLCGIEHITPSDFELSTPQKTEELLATFKTTDDLLDVMI